MYPVCPHAHAIYCLYKTEYACGHLYLCWFPEGDPAGPVVPMMPPTYGVYSREPPTLT